MLPGLFSFAHRADGFTARSAARKGRERAAGRSKTFKLDLRGGTGTGRKRPTDPVTVGARAVRFHSQEGPR